MYPVGFCRTDEISLEFPTQGSASDATVSVYIDFVTNFHICELFLDSGFT